MSSSAGCNAGLAARRIMILLIWSQRAGLGSHFTGHGTGFSDMPNWECSGKTDTKTPPTPKSCRASAKPRWYEPSRLKHAGKSIQPGFGVVDGQYAHFTNRITRLPAGVLFVFFLAGAIAVAAFVARRYETRRLVPAHA